MTEACSGKGYCSSEGICICNDGWSGRGEMIDRTGIDCNVNQTGINVIHAMGIVVALLAFIVAARANWRAVKIAWYTRAPNVSQSGAVGVSSQSAGVIGGAGVAGAVASTPSTGRLSWLWSALTNDSASSIGLYVIIFSPICVLCHILRIAMGGGSEAYQYWGDQFSSGSAYPSLS
jgi:hypothetical protein